MNIEIPNGWEPRYHQWDAWDYSFSAGSRSLLIWHRRGGKDSVAMNGTCVAAHTGVPGMYWHLLPTQVQARKVVWNGIDFHGRRMIDQAFPMELRTKTHTQDMYIEFACGSGWQLGGSDNYNSLVGSNVRGVIFSEWALCDPAAWDYVRPILLENGGWALFITTPRGRNHCWLMYEKLRTNPKWLVQLLDVEDTRREDGSRIFTDAMIQEERDSGMSEEMIQQEYYCSFAAGVVGTIYGRAMEKAREEERIGKVPYDRRLPVHTYWDIGIDDATAVWFGQRRGYERRFFRYEEFKDEPLVDIFEKLEAMPYRYAFHNFPHDAKQRDKGTGRRIIEYADDIFRGNGEVVDIPQQSMQDTHEVTRVFLDQCWFDEEGCERGIHCLLNYRKIWDDKRSAYQDKPYHDWSSHGATAFEKAAWVDADEPVIEDLPQHYRQHYDKPARVIRSAR